MFLEMKELATEEQLGAPLPPPPKSQPGPLHLYLKVTVHPNFDSGHE